MHMNKKIIKFKAHSYMAARKWLHRDEKDLYYLRKVFPYVLANFHCDGPGQVALELSNRCNLRCKMCWFHGENGVGDRYGNRELTTHTIFSIVDQLARQSPHIYIGGAEPFIRKDFLMILEHIKGKNMPVSFTTNGTLLDSGAIEKLVDYGVDEVNFSIDGNEELHDRIRGEGVFNRVTHAVIKLSEYKKKKVRIKPVITINIAITNNLTGRVKEAVHAIRHSTADGADFYRLHHLWYVTQTELAVHKSTIKRRLGCAVPGAAGHVLPTSRISDPSMLADEINSLRGLPKVTMFPDLQYDDIVAYYSERPHFRKRCIAPFFGAVIKPNGDVRFCPDEWIDDYILGNLCKESFHDVWNNKRARRFREVLLKEKSFAGCNRCSWMHSFA